MTGESARESPSVAEARRQVEQARARLWGTFDAIVEHARRLQEKFEPSHIARDAWDAAKSKGADMAEDAVDAVRKRPMMVGGAVAALALVLAREPLMGLAGKAIKGTSKKKAKKKPGKTPASRKERVETANE